MNIINEYKFLLAYFLYCACFEQQKLCCYNVAPSLACIKSKQSGDYIIVRQRIRGSTRFRSPSVVAMATARGLLNRVDLIGCAVQLI